MQGNPLSQRVPLHTTRAVTCGPDAHLFAPLHTRLRAYRTTVLPEPSPDSKYPIYLKMWHLDMPPQEGQEPPDAVLGTARILYSPVCMYCLRVAYYPRRGRSQGSPLPSSTHGMAQFQRFSSFVVPGSRFWCFYEWGRAFQPPYPSEPSAFLQTSLPGFFVPRVPPFENMVCHAFEYLINLTRRHIRRDVNLNVDLQAGALSHGLIGSG
jgi:hypothetical protein